ncbi:MAG: pantoate--beta-alanine ligase [Acidimicrobiia bacterium]|nr:pantoate--beta-alanine ligase [Acidimicrobiia bacterium]
MESAHTIREARGALDAARCGGSVIGFVPTMGFLHAGHRSLIERSVAQTDFTVVSVFVNPLQFAPTEDFSSYPRDLVADVSVIRDAGADLVFVPSVAEMYPEPITSVVRVQDVSSGLESISRPTHFEGVSTVVAKLFNIIGPCRAFFGEKDYQQLAIITRMAADLSFPVTVVGCPTVREPDGLAMSSRNAYLSGPEREAATVLNRALVAGRSVIADGERSPTAVEATLAEVIDAEPLATRDYVAVRSADLAVIDEIAGPVRLLVAAEVGPARLIDNCAAGID